MAQLNLTDAKVQQFLDLAKAQLERLGGIETEGEEAEQLRDTIGCLQRYQDEAAVEDEAYAGLERYRWMRDQVFKEGKFLLDDGCGVEIEALAEAAAAHFNLPLDKDLEEWAAQVWHEDEDEE